MSDIVRIDSWISFHLTKLSGKSFHESHCVILSFNPVFFLFAYQSLDPYNYGGENDWSHVGSKNKTRGR